MRHTETRVRLKLVNKTKEEGVGFLAGVQKERGEVALRSREKEKGWGSMMKTHKEKNRVAALEQEKRMKGVESRWGTLRKDWV